MIAKKSCFTSLIISTLFLSSQSCVTRISEIDTIIFEYSNSLRIPFHNVKVTMKEEEDSIYVIVKSRPGNSDTAWRYSGIDTNYFVGKNLFLTIAKELEKLNRINMEKAYTSGIDGYRAKIEFGNKGKHTSYSFFCPLDSTSQRGLLDFMHISEKILTIANLRKDQVFSAP